MTNLVSVCLGISLSLSLCTAFSPDISYVCPAGWEIYRNQCYLYVGASKKHDQCRNHCISRGGDLLSVWTSEELSFIKNFIRVRIASQNLLGWTGLKWSSTTGWRWSDGSLQQYFQWYSQPKGSYNQDMCAAVVGGSGRLYPAPCGNIMSIFICKREAVVVYELGLPWESLSSESAYNSTVTQGREAMYHLSTDVDGVLGRVNMSSISMGRNEADCGLICMKKPGCSAFVFKCRQATGCDKYDCVFAYS